MVVSSERSVIHGLREEVGMNHVLFWLSDEQFERISPHLPRDTRGKPRVDDRRVISGIVHILKSGRRWVDAPADYGPRKTLYNRYVRGAAKESGNAFSMLSRPLLAHRRTSSSTVPL